MDISWGQEWMTLSESRLVITTKSGCMADSVTHNEKWEKQAKQ